MGAIATFMNTGIGRVLRIVLGLVLIYLGLVTLGGAGGAVLAVIGVVPIVMGLWGRCLVEFIPGVA
jgi:hypothetical protein